MRLDARCGRSPGAPAAALQNTNSGEKLHSDVFPHHARQYVRQLMQTS